MTLIDKPPLAHFSDLVGSQKKRFNNALNKYVSELPEEEWEQKITTDFNEIVLDDIMNERFQAEKYYVGSVNLTPQLLEEPKEEKIEV
jgi:transcriptional accessory protein Tex/SPT6